jgi:hypothetical protein
VYRNIIMERVRGILVVFILATCFYSCKDTGNSPLPYVPINRSLTLSNPQYNALFGIGGFLILPEEGVGGIIAVRATDDQIFAFDLQCTKDVYDVNSATRPDASQLFLDCTVCHSQWLLLNGQVNKGPATFPLHQYNTSFDGFVLKIYN